MKLRKLSFIGLTFTLTSGIMIPTSLSAAMYSNTDYAKAMSKAYGNICVITTDDLEEMDDVNGVKAIRWAQKASDYRSTHYDENDVFNSETGAAAHVSWRELPELPETMGYGIASLRRTLTPERMVEVNKGSSGHDRNWKDARANGSTVALGVTQKGNNTFIQGFYISVFDDFTVDGQYKAYRSTKCAGDGVNPLAWRNSGVAKKYTSGKVKKSNSIYVEDYKQKQVAKYGYQETISRTIRTDYKKGTYDANGHTKTWENWDYDTNGKWTNKTVTEYKYNSLTKKEVASKVTKYKNVNGKAKITSTKVTPTKWTTKKTYSKFKGKAHKADGTYAKDQYKQQISNFGTKRTIHTDGVKGTYGSNGKTKTWEHWYFDGNGKEIKKSKYSYDSRGREVNRTVWKNKSAGNKTRFKTEYKNTKYHANGRVKSTSTYTYFKNSNTTSKNVYNEYYSNGKPKVYKDTYYKSNGKVKEVRQSKFTSTGKRTKSVKKY